MRLKKKKGNAIELDLREEKKQLQKKKKRKKEQSKDKFFFLRSATEAGQYRLMFIQSQMQNCINSDA